MDYYWMIVQNVLIGEKRNKIPEFITKYGILEKEIKKWNIKGINK